MLFLTITVTRCTYSPSKISTGTGEPAEGGSTPKPKAEKPPQTRARAAQFFRNHPGCETSFETEVC